MMGNCSSSIDATTPDESVCEDGGVRGAPIELHVLLSHARRGEAALEGAAADPPVDGVDAPCGVNCLVQVVTDETRDAVVDDLGNRSAADGHHRCPARERLDHHQTEGFGPIDREQQRGCTSKKCPLLFFGDLAAVVDERVSQQRMDVLLEVPLVRRVYFGRDLERTTTGLRDVDRAIDTLLRRDTAEESQISALAGTEL